MDKKAYFYCPPRMNIPQTDGSKGNSILIWSEDRLERLELKWECDKGFKTVISEAHISEGTILLLKRVYELLENYPRCNSVVTIDEVARLLINAGFEDRSDIPVSSIRDAKGNPVCPECDAEFYLVKTRIIKGEYVYESDGVPVFDEDVCDSWEEVQGRSYFKCHLCNNVLPYDYLD